MQGNMVDKPKGATARFWDEAVLGDTPGVGNQPIPVAAASEVTSLCRPHSILKYNRCDPDTNLFCNGNSVAFYSEVIAQTGTNDGMASRLNTLFTSAPPHYGIQWCLFDDPVLGDQLQAYMDRRHIAVDNDRTTLFFRELTKHRVEYIYKAEGKPFWPNDSHVVENIHLLSSITKAGSFRDAKLVEEIYELRETVRASLCAASLPSFPLNTDGPISFLWPILNLEDMSSKEPFPDLRYDGGKSIKNRVTASGQCVHVKANEPLFGLPPEERDDEDKRIAVRGFGVLQYPRKKELWKMASIIGLFFDDGLRYPYPFLVCDGVFTLDPNVVDGEAQIKVTRTKQNARSRMAEFQPELQVQANDWDVALHQLNNGGSMCELYHALLLFVPKRVINWANQVALNMWCSERFTICPLQLPQLTVLYSSLPMTLTETVRDDLRKLRLITSKTTVNAVGMTPVIGEWKSTGDPMMMLFGRHGTPTFLGFYSNQQGNYNMFVAGVSGPGKSVTMNEVVSAYRGIGTQVWVIDVGRSYQNLIRLQKGTFLEFTPNTELCINPFTWVDTGDELDFKAEMRMLKPVIGRMASPNASLTEFQYALIGKAIAAVWRGYRQDINPTHIRGHLLSNIRNESGNIEHVAYELARQPAPFAKDGVYGDFFSSRANISLDTDMVGLELEELKNALELRRVMLFVLTLRIIRDMYLIRDHKELCLVDEAQQLLGADKEAAEFTEEGYRRARKCNDTFCVGTQGIEDTYKNSAAQAAYNNTDQKILLHQDYKNLKKLIEDGMVNFPPAMKRVLLSLRIERGRFSEMPISSPNGDSVMRRIPDPFSLLMALTNAQNFNECNALLEQDHSAVETLKIMLARRAPQEQLSPCQRKDDY